MTSHTILSFTYYMPKLTTLFATCVKKEKDGKEQSPKRNSTIKLSMSLRSEIIYFIQYPTHRKK